MTKFELYHPIFTDHYGLDWLTMSKVRSIFELRNDPQNAEQSDRPVDQTLEETTDYVNDIMRLIMHNQALVWGISAKDTHEFLGIFEISNFDLEQKSVAIHFEILRHHQREGIMQEILTRMTVFCFEELGMFKITATVLKDNPATIALLDRAGFEIRSKQGGDAERLVFELTVS